MKKTCNNSGLKISYDIEGKGIHIVLLHGYLETSKIWCDFAKRLSQFYTVIAVDLPGHGNSDLHSEPFTMCKYSEAVNSVLEAENIQKAFIVGHSMGGYAALAFAENFPNKLSALCLFHSAPFADNSEKKILRNKTIADLEEGKKEQIVNIHCNMLFAKNNLSKFSQQIKQNITEALSIKNSGIIASLKTMRDRKDRSSVLKNLKVPFLLIHGKYDNFISESVINSAEMPENGKFVILEHSGHAGFIEEPEVSETVFIDFINLFVR